MVNHSHCVYLSLSNAALILRAAWCMTRLHAITSSLRSATKALSLRFSDLSNFICLFVSSFFVLIILFPFLGHCSFLLIVRTKWFLPLQVHLDTRIFQHIADFPPHSSFCIVILHFDFCILNLRRPLHLFFARFITPHEAPQFRRRRPMLTRRGQMRTK